MQALPVAHLRHLSIARISSRAFARHSMQALPVAPLRYPTTLLARRTMPKHDPPCRRCRRIPPGTRPTRMHLRSTEADPRCTHDRPRTLGARPSLALEAMPKHDLPCRRYRPRTSQHPTFPRAARTGRNRPSTHAVPAEYLRYPTGPHAARIHRSRSSTHAHPPRISVPNLACTSVHAEAWVSVQALPAAHLSVRSTACTRDHAETQPKVLAISPREAWQVRLRPAHLLEFSSLLSDPPSSASSTSPSYPFDVFDALSLRVRERGSLRF
jgi:hypothetical protein